MSVPVDHDILFYLDEAVMRYYGLKGADLKSWTRMSKSIEFQDNNGGWHEIVVRPIEEPSDV